MIQFNLLPDIKLEYVKARKTKHAVIMISSLVGIVSFVIFALLFFSVNFVQTAHLKNLTADIDGSKKQLQDVPDLAKILTIQGQLNSLPELHEKKPVASRLLGFVQQVSPNDISISSLNVNFTDSTIKFEGSASSLASVNTFIDTLKFTNYVTQTKADGSTDDVKSDPERAFSEVILSSFAVNNSSSGDKNKAMSYTVTLKFKEDIFKSDKNVELQVANKITTRSETEKPATFQAKPTNADQGEER